MTQDLNPEGRYFSRTMIGAGSALSEEKGTPYIYLTYEIDHFLEGDEWTPLDSTMRKDVRLYLSQKSQQAASISMEKLEKIGFNGDFVAPEFDPEFLSDVTLICKHRNGYEDWQLEAWGNGMDRVDMPGNVAGELSERWKTYKATQAKPKAGSAPPKPAPAQPPATNTPKPGEVPPGTAPEEIPPPHTDKDLPF